MNKKDISDYHIYHDGKLNRTGHLYEKNTLCHEIEPTASDLKAEHNDASRLTKEDWKQTCSCGRFIIWQNPTKKEHVKIRRKNNEWKCLFCELNAKRH